MYNFDVHGCNTVETGQCGLLLIMDGHTGDLRTNNTNKPYHSKASIFFKTIVFSRHQAELSIHGNVGYNILIILFVIVK